MKKKLFQASLALVLCFFVFSCGKDDGPNESVDTSPSITGFSPTSGPVGTAVTINGENFGATPANNTVKFGTITATVGSASASSLQVTVPEGAQTAKISVSVNGETATSSAAFTVTEEPDPTTVVLDQATLELKTLDTDQLVATVAGAGANETVVWSSDNEDAAIVDQEGNVTATGAGTVTITATVDGVMASCAITVNPSIFVGGTVEKNNGNYDVATYWVNGVKTELNDIDSDDVFLDVEGGDIYTTFTEYDMDGDYIRVMKNSNLHSTLGGLDSNSKASLAIDVVGNDIYVAGYEDSGIQENAKYWKNGAEVVLSDGETANAQDLVVQNGSIYLAGFKNVDGYTPYYWVDGSAVELPYGTEIGKANGIYVDALNNVYTAGYKSVDFELRALVWKNETELFLLGDVNSSSNAHAIFVHNNDVFVTGNEYSNNTGVLWINGSMAYEWSGAGNDITVHNNTIYVAGIKYDGNINSYTPTVFTFDTSGNLIEEISLPSDGSNGYATSIVVK